MDEMLARIKEFQLLAEIPTIKSAEIVEHDKNHSTVRTTLTSRSYGTLSRYTHRPQISIENNSSSTDLPKTHWLNGEDVVETGSDPIKAKFSAHPLSSDNNAAETPFTVILRETKNGKKGDCRTVELWQGQRLLRRVDVTDAHGPFFTDELYGSFSIHGDRVLYTAERKLQGKEVDLAERVQVKDIDDDGLEKYEYKPPLGSGYLDRDYPDVFLLAFNLTSVSSQGDKPAQLYCLQTESALQNLVGHEQYYDPLLSQAIFSSDGEKVVLTAYPTIQDGRRFGLAACTNRPSIVFCVDVQLEKEAEKIAGNSQENKRNNAKKDKIESALKWNPKEWHRLSREGYSARSPSMALKDKCVWLECRTGGPHKGCDSICSANISKNVQIGQNKCELDQQQFPDQQTGWPGLYADSTLSRCCSLSSFNSIIMTSVWGSRQTIITLEIGKGDLPTEITPLQLNLVGDNEKILSETEQPWNYSLLCTNGKDLIVAVRSSPTCPQQLLIGRMTGNKKVIWKAIRSLDEEWQSESCLSTLKQSIPSKVIQIPGTELAGQGEQSVEAIVIPPVSFSKGQKMPLILIPHGGPHSPSTTGFSPAIASLALTGFCVVQPNYHGSLGKGQRFVSSLVGQCGSLDVKDCQRAVEFVMESSNELYSGLELDPDHVYVDGGSHGGFLSLHLVGQYPSFYRASICRNPVTAAHIMEYTNDIADWFYSEFGLPFDFSKPPKCISAEQFAALERCSPFAYINAIQVPVLLLVGLADQRVNPSQSKLIFHSLQSRVRESQKASSKTNLQVRMLTFEGQGHSLDGIEAELISFEARLRWLKKSQ